MKAALAFFSVVIVGLLGLLTAATLSGAPLAPPIAGTWSGGGHQFQVAGTLEGGFTISAASSWKVFGCPINSGDVLFRYVAKGGSSYDLTWIVVWATTTQGQEGVKCENTYEGPKTVTVTRSATGAINLACIGSACSDTGAIKLVAAKPAPTKDTSPPQVKAFDTEGFATRNESVAMKFTVTDDSGRARVHNTVYQGGTKIGRSVVSPWLSATGQMRSWPGKVDVNNTGPLYFCLWAEDAAGNRGKASCAWIPLVVPIAATGANTCGGEGWDAFVAVQRYFGNKHTYSNSNKNPFAKSYPVNFAEACNIHDAGYGGYAVIDTINGNKPVDFRLWKRSQVDRKFLFDMRKLCMAKIPASATIALANCQARGGNASIGAEYLHGLVAKIGWRFFDTDLTKPGIQKVGHRQNFD